MGDRIEAFDKRAADAVLKQAVERLKAFADELGLEVRPAGGKFDAGVLTAKIEFRLATVNGVGREEAEFKKDCGVFNLQPADYGAEITLNGRKVKIAGLNRHGRKFPILVIDNDGKRLVVGDEMVRKQLGREFAWEKRVA
jgi:hypothetical protein